MTTLPWPVLLKFAASVLLTIGITYSLAWLVRCLPGVKQVL